MACLATLCGGKEPAVPSAAVSAEPLPGTSAGPIGGIPLTSMASRVGDTDSHALARGLELGIRTPTLWRGPLIWGYGLPRFDVAQWPLLRALRPRGVWPCTTAWITCRPLFVFFLL